MKSYEIKKLNKAYAKRLKTLNKEFFNTKNIGLLLFLEYLKYQRDTLFFETTENITASTKLATMITAVAELEAYLKDGDQKPFHLNNFCELLKQNLEEWLTINDSV